MVRGNFEVCKNLTHSSKSIFTEKLRTENRQSIALEIEVTSLRIQRYKDWLLTNNPVDI